MEPVPSTVFQLTADSAIETCCPGERRCPEIQGSSTSTAQNEQLLTQDWTNITSSSLVMNTTQTDNPAQVITSVHLNCLCGQKGVSHSMSLVTIIQYQWRSWTGAQFHLVVCSQVVNLLLEHTRPKVFANKLHDVQLVFEPCCVFCHSRERKNKQEDFNLRLKKLHSNFFIILLTKTR